MHASWSRHAADGILTHADPDIVKIWVLQCASFLNVISRGKPDSGPQCIRLLSAFMRDMFRLICMQRTTGIQGMLAALQKTCFGPLCQIDSEQSKWLRTLT